jgi:hypothetical protein
VRFTHASSEEPLDQVLVCRDDGTDCCFKSDLEGDLDDCSCT